VANLRALLAAHPVQDEGDLLAKILRNAPPFNPEHHATVSFDIEHVMCSCGQVVLNSEIAQHQATPVQVTTAVPVDAHHHTPYLPATVLYRPEVTP